MTTFKLNNQLNGVEIYFNNKPEREILENLKENGFRWSGKKLCWYAKQSKETLNIAETLSNGEELETVARAPGTPPTAPDKKAISLYERVQFKEGNADITQYNYNLVGSNYTGLDTKETAKIIRQHLKKQFPEVKFSVTSSFNKINIEIKESPYNYKQLEYSPELERRDYRKYEAENNKEIQAIQEYCNRLLKSYNYDDSDMMTDYFNTHYYTSISVDYDYKQTEQSEEVKKDIENFRNQLIQDLKAEEIKKELEFREWQKKRDLEEIEYKEQATAAEKQKEYIYNNVEAKELKEKDQYIIIGAKFANLNKNNTLEEYQEEIRKDDYITQAAKVEKEIYFKDKKSLEYFSNMLLHDFNFISGGGTYTNDKRIKTMQDFNDMTKAERKSVKWINKVIAIYFNNQIQYIINPEGHSYSRYVGLIDKLQYKAI